MEWRGPEPFPRGIRRLVSPSAYLLLSVFHPCVSVALLNRYGCVRPVCAHDPGHKHASMSFDVCHTIPHHDGVNHFRHEIAPLRRVSRLRRRSLRSRRHPSSQAEPAHREQSRGLSESQVHHRRRKRSRCRSGPGGRDAPGRASWPKPLGATGRSAPSGASTPSCPSCRSATGRSGMRRTSSPGRANRTRPNTRR